MLPFREVKSDIRSGYDYMEYEKKWYGFDTKTIISSRFQTVTLHLSDRHGSTTFEFRYVDFLALSYTEYIGYVDSNIYYNLALEAN